MKIGQGLLLGAAACSLMFAACKKSDSGTGSAAGTGGGAGTAGTSTTGTSGTGAAGAAGKSGTGGAGAAGKGGTGGAGAAGAAGRSGTSGAGAAGMAAGTAGASASGGKAVATITAFGTGATVTGTATFTQTGADVALVVQLNGCVAGKMYPVHIHEGTSCMTEATQGAHWGMAMMPVRGEGIPKVMCTGTTGTAMHTRMGNDPLLPWTVGGDATTNVVGHAFVVHDPDVAMAPPRIGCGVITKQ